MGVTFKDLGIDRPSQSDNYRQADQEYVETIRLIDELLPIVRDCPDKAEVDEAVAHLHTIIDHAASLRKYPPKLVEVPQE